ncbi:MAG: recombinase family protein [Candidatus Tumulicola sp.]
MRPSRIKTENRRTVGYVRVSTEEQAAAGVSLAAQEARIAAYATAMGWHVSEVIRDGGASAKSLARPGMAFLLAQVRAGTVERIIVAKLDRLTRSVRDIADLVDLCAQYDVALCSIGETLDTSSAAGRMIVNMLGVIAQWEREAIGERTAEALRHKRQQGCAYGPIPFGYRRDGDALIRDNREQAALTEAVRMDKAGRSFREIGATLTTLGVMPRRASTWHASCVRAVLRSRMATAR